MAWEHREVSHSNASHHQFPHHQYGEDYAVGLRVSRSIRSAVSMTYYMYAVDGMTIRTRP